MRRASSSRRFRQVLAIALSTFVVACQSRVADTEGNAFDVECEGTTCSLVPSKESDEKSYRVRREGRVLTACPAAGDDFECRPLRCEESAACAKLGGVGFQCSKGICQATAQDITSADRVALCLAETGPFRRTALQLERVTAARACRGACTVPAACMTY